MQDEYQLDKRGGLQIVLMGWEWDRLIEGIKLHLPQKVVFICPHQATEGDYPTETRELAERIGKQIGTLIDYESRYVNYQDFQECLRTIKKVLYDHPEYDPVTLNISAGSKLLIAAAVLVSQYYPCNLFYAIPKKYNRANEEFFSHGVKRFVKVPTFQFNESIVPKKMEQTVFTLIDEQGTSLTQIVKKYLTSIKKKPDEHTLRNTKSLFLYHLKNLERKKLVWFDRKGRELTVHYTPTGEFLQDVTEDQA